jgi:hypothetical protein
MNATFRVSQYSLKYLKIIFNHHGFVCLKVSSVECFEYATKSSLPILRSLEPYSNHVPAMQSLLDQLPRKLRLSLQMV